MKTSLAVIEYSLENIDFLYKKGIEYPQVYYVPIGASSAYKAPNNVHKDIDVLFYGDFKSSPRRRSLLDHLDGKFSLHRVDDAFSDDIKTLIARSKVVLNLHYYEGAQLEMPRIQECLSLGAPIVSENTADMTDYPWLSGAVTFFETGNEDGMEKALDAALSEADSKQEPIQAAVEFGEQRHNFMIDRFLMGLNILPVKALEKFDPVPMADGDTFALSLPETINRRRTFDAETKTPEICTFDGIRRTPGWVGCGMSYKYLCHSAILSKVENFTIIEDDVIFAPNFDFQMKSIKEYLKKRSGEWDIFSGVIAHLHEDVKVRNVESYNGIDFVTIDKMTSMIFNIYGARAINVIDKWDPRDENVEYNTIDRYLESSDLRVVVAHPFVAGHREELISTLWGFENTQYRDMIKESERKLGKLKNRWIESRVLERS